MTEREPGQAIEIGAPAPRFSLPSVCGERLVALDDYVGRSAVLVALLRGVYCAFCRRNIAQLEKTAESLKSRQVDTVVVVTTPLERARLYYRYRPAQVCIAADPDLSAHRAYGLPWPRLVKGTSQWPLSVTVDEFERVAVDADGEVPEPMPISQVGRLLDRADGFEYTAIDEHDAERTWNLMTGLFLVDREGMVRWRYIEALADVTELTRFPSQDDIEAAVGGLSP